MNKDELTDFVSSMIREMNLCLGCAYVSVNISMDPEGGEIASFWTVDGGKRVSNIGADKLAGEDPDRPERAPELGRGRNEVPA